MGADILGENLQAVTLSKQSQQIKRKFFVKTTSVKQLRKWSYSINGKDQPMILNKDN